MSTPKTGLPAGALRMLQECNAVQPVRITDGLTVARVLAKRGYLEQVGEDSFLTTTAGREMLLKSVEFT